MPPPSRGVRGRWALVRLARRIVMILSTFGRWGIKPPRHADACHPSAEGNFVPLCDESQPPPSVVKSNLPRNRAVGIRTTGATNYYDFFHSWAVGH